MPQKNEGSDGSERPDVNPLPVLVTLGATRLRMCTGWTKFAVVIQMGYSIQNHVTRAEMDAYYSYLQCNRQEISMFVFIREVMVLKLSAGDKCVSEAGTWLIMTLYLVIIYVVG